MIYTISLWYQILWPEQVCYPILFFWLDYLLVQVLVINCICQRVYFVNMECRAVFSYCGWATKTRINMIKYQADAIDVVKKHTRGLCNLTLATCSFIYYISYILKISPHFHSHWVENCGCSSHLQMNEDDTDFIQILHLGAVSPHSSHHPQEVILAQFSLFVHKWPKTPFISYLNPLIQVDTYSVSWE